MDPSFCMTSTTSTQFLFKSHSFPALIERPPCQFVRLIHRFNEPSYLADLFRITTATVDASVISGSRQQAFDS